MVDREDLRVEALSKDRIGGEVDPIEPAADAGDGQSVIGNGPCDTNGLPGGTAGRRSNITDLQIRGRGLRDDDRSRELVLTDTGQIRMGVRQDHDEIGSGRDPRWDRDNLLGAVTLANEKRSVLGVNMEYHDLSRSAVPNRVGTDGDSVVPVAANGHATRVGDGVGDRHLIALIIRGGRRRGHRDGGHMKEARRHVEHGDRIGGDAHVIGVGKLLNLVVKISINRNVVRAH